MILIKKEQQIVRERLPVTFNYFLFDLSFVNLPPFKQYLNVCSISFRETIYPDTSKVGGKTLRNWPN